MLGGGSNQKRDLSLEEMVSHLSHQSHAAWPPVCQQEVSEILHIGSPASSWFPLKIPQANPGRGGNRGILGGRKALEGQLECDPWTAAPWDPITQECSLQL